MAKQTKSKKGIISKNDSGRNAGTYSESSSDRFGDTARNYVSGDSAGTSSGHKFNGKDKGSLPE